MAKNERAQVAYQAFRQMFVMTREPTRRTLVEFFESDWERISRVKEELDLSWKEFFHAIALWLDAFEADPESQQLVANLVRKSATGR